MNGHLIVLYGINNLGKTTQAKLLVDRLQAAGKQAEYLKYALYNIEPSGALINDYLRKGNPYNFSAREFQLLQVLNRTQYDAELRAKLAAGQWLVAEDYVGTGIAWGMGAGVDRQLLEKLNQHLVKEDLAFYFKGARFTAATERNHRHETDEALITKVAACHDELAASCGWLSVNANDTIENISELIWSKVKERL